MLPRRYLRMKIAHVYDEHYRVSPEKGSVAKVIYNLAITQAELGHDVTVLERQWSGLPQQENQDGVQFTRFPLSIGSDIEGEEIPYKQIKSPIGILTLLSDRFELALKLRRHFKQTDYDIVHFHLPFTSNILVHIHPEIRSKLIYTAHAGEIRFGLQEEDRISSLLALFSPDLHLMRRAAKSSVLNQTLEKKLPIDNLEIIPNGVDIEEYSSSPPDSIDFESDIEIERPFVLFVGTITPRKGPDILLDAISILEERNVADEFDFVLAGNKEIKEDFSNQLINRAENSSYDIYFPGFVSIEELKALYANCDLFVLPSREEGWGMVTTEAMAAETPIVASRVSGIPEQVIDGQNGYLVPPDAPKPLANKLQSLTEDYKKRKKMGERSRELAIQKFSWRSVAEQYLSMYDSVLSTDEL